MPLFRALAKNMAPMTNADESPTNRLTLFWLNISLFIVSTLCLWHPASEQKNFCQYMKNMLKFCSHPEALKTNFIEYVHRQPKNRCRKLYINDWAYTRLNPLWFNARHIILYYSNVNVLRNDNNVARVKSKEDWDEYMLNH